MYITMVCVVDCVSDTECLEITFPFRSLLPKNSQGHYNGPENSNKMADDYQPPKSIPYYGADEYY